MSSEEYTATIDYDGGSVTITRKQRIDAREFADTLRESVEVCENIDNATAHGYAWYLARECPSLFDGYFADPEFTQWHSEALTENYDGFLDTARPTFELLAQVAGYSDDETARMFEALKQNSIEGWVTNLCDPTIPTGKHMLESSRWMDYMDERLCDTAPES